MVGALIVLCLVDMWQVNKRYLNNDMFVNKSVRETPIQLTPTDEIILQDKDNCGNHRVLNFSTNTFNENETSYYHKSIGGYHAAKLRRYQELADAYIRPEMSGVMKAVAEAGGDMTQINGDSVCPVLNMLNTKYFIVPLQDNKTIPLQNPYTYGNAWFVDKITYVDNANDELAAVGKISLRHEAVADKKFKDVLGDTKVQDNTSIVNITLCEPNHLKYTVKSATGGIIVFSEVYYPGWTATIDGKPAELGRVNYILRALNVSAGTHEVELDFHPQSISVTETIAYIAFALLLVVIIFMVLLNGRNKQKKQ